MKASLSGANDAPTVHHPGAGDARGYKAKSCNVAAPFARVPSSRKRTNVREVSAEASRHGTERL